MIKNLCFFVENFDEILSIYIETSNNYRQTENMYNIHPGNNESDKRLKNLQHCFHEVTVDKAAHKVPNSMYLYKPSIYTLFLREQLKFKGYSLQWRNFIFKEPTE